MKKYDKPAMRMVKMVHSKMICQSGPNLAPRHTRDWDNED